ncbi:UNVERIFIED_CONTAM: Dirigent protein 4 [Sesamum radiatum]|uniref:Dirigent protein n=1 Tax=Sesamum radiatum TaxID=300843 RepID=A0AAW2RWB4_SESRA
MLIMHISNSLLSLLHFTDNMAKVVIFLVILIVTISSLSTAILPSRCVRNTPPPDTEESWFQNVICNGNEDTVILHFYVQDVLAGENKTVYEVARADITSTSPTSFGQVLVADDRLTAEPDYYSEEIGRVQGLVTSADLDVPTLSMYLNFVFTSGAFNGSTISIQGRNELLSQQRELAVVGGAGVFRFARGYAILTTYYFDPEMSQYGVLEYTIYVRGSSSSMGVHAGV